VPNRTIERNTPLNFVKSSDVGAQPNCLPFDLEGGVHYVAIAEKGLKDYAAGGNQLLRLDESAVTSSTSFEANPVSLLSSHLVFGVVRSARQKALSDLDASKGWLMRADGRLVAGQFIRNQDITGFCEWIAAASGLVREIGIDGQNSLWLAVDRNGEGTIELYDPTCLLQDAVEAVPDLAGAVTGLEFENGAELWAVADGYVLGPYTCQNGAIDLQEPHASALVGRWQAPRWESMAQVYVTPSDDVVWRPGRIHTLAVNIIDTTSIAVGANGGDPVDVVLNEVDDPVNQAMPAKTKLITVNGADLTGYMTGTTAVITHAISRLERNSDGNPCWRYHEPFRWRRRSCSDGGRHHGGRVFRHFRHGSFPWLSPTGHCDRAGRRLVDRRGQWRVRPGGACGFRCRRRTEP